MPRVAPIVRSTKYEHAINTLVAKRAEISGLVRFKGADLALVLLLPKAGVLRVR